MFQRKFMINYPIFVLAKLELMVTLLKPYTAAQGQLAMLVLPIRYQLSYLVTECCQKLASEAILAQVELRQKSFFWI